MTLVVGMTVIICYDRCNLAGSINRRQTSAGSTPKLTAILVGLNMTHLEQQKVKDVLEACLQGMVHPSLKDLYQMPLRGEVHWTDFPAWARPDYLDEGCREG